MRKEFWRKGSAGLWPMPSVPLAPKGKGMFWLESRIALNGKSLIQPSVNEKTEFYAVAWTKRIVGRVRAVFDRESNRPRCPHPMIETT